MENEWEIIERKTPRRTRRLMASSLRHRIYINAKVSCLSLRLDVEYRAVFIFGIFTKTFYIIYILADCIFRFCNSASKKGKLKSNSIHKYPCDGSHLLACRKKNMNRKKRKSKNKSMKFRAISRWILKLYANLSIYKLNKCSSNYEELQKWKKCVYHVR